MSEITLALEHPSLGCGEIIARYDLSKIQEKAYQQGKADEKNRIVTIINAYDYRGLDVELVRKITDEIIEQVRGGEND